MFTRNSRAPSAVPSDDFGISADLVSGANVVNSSDDYTRAAMYTTGAGLPETHPLSRNPSRWSRLRTTVASGLGHAFGISNGSRQLRQLTPSLQSMTSEPVTFTREPLREPTSAGARFPSISQAGNTTPVIVSAIGLGLTTLPPLPLRRFLVKPTTSITNISTALIPVLETMGVSMNDFNKAMRQRTFTDLIGTSTVTNVLTNTSMFNVELLGINPATDFLMSSIPIGLLGAAAIAAQITGSASDFCKMACELWFNAMEEVPEAINYPVEVTPIIEAFMDTVPTLLSKVLLLHYFNMDITEVTLIGLENIITLIVHNIKERIIAIKANENLQFTLEKAQEQGKQKILIPRS